MNELDKLAKKYGTDKQTNEKGSKPIYHGYTKKYYEIFKPLQHTCKSLLEIGVREGWSHQMWYDFFPNSMIYGLDLYKEYPKENIKIENDRIKLFEGDQGDEKRLEELFGSFEFDIVIDDGAHHCREHQISFKKLFPKLKSGGYYIIEDMATCRMAAFNQNGDLKYSTISFLERLQCGEFMSHYISDGNPYLEHVKKVELIGELGIITKK